MHKIFFLSFLIFIGTNAAVGGELTELYRKQTINVIQKLESARIEKIACYYGPIYGPLLGNPGCFTPSELIEKLNQIKFIETNSFTKPNGATRWTAFYDPSSTNIYLNQRANHDPEIAGFIGFHELLGAVDRADQEYQISLDSLLYLESIENELPDQVSHQFRSHLEYDSGFFVKDDAISIANNTLVASSGGGTIVGGGGDQESLRIRLEVYRYLENLYSKYKISLPHIHPILLIEIVEDSGSEILQQNVAQRDTTKIWIRYLVPRHLLTQTALHDPRAPNIAVETIGQLIAKKDPLSDIGPKDHE